MGTINTAYIDKFREDVQFELQKAKTAYPFINIDMEMGDKSYFDIIGKASAVLQTKKLQIRELQTPEFERRYFVKRPYELPLALDRMDESRVAKDLKGPFLRTAVNGIIRYRDFILTDAILGNANVVEDGALTLTALPSSQKVAVGFNPYRETAVTGNVGLTIEKISAAIAILEANYVTETNPTIHVIGRSRQIRGMLAHAQRKGLEAPLGLSPQSVSDMNALSSFLGVQFHINNEMPLDSSGNDQVVVMTDDAVVAGASSLARVFEGDSLAHIGNPWVVAVYEDMGAVRAYEEKVVVIAAAPGTNNVPPYAVS